MPKMTNYPRLRTLVRKGANGQRWVYFYYDMRHEGKPDIPLGKDHATALAKWDEIHNQKPRIKGTIEEAFVEWEEKVLPTYTNPSTRTMYRKGLRFLRPIFAKATWDAVELPDLILYLESRDGKTQANRDMSTFQVVWNYARKRGFTKLHWPAAGMERSGWKNKEQARRVKVTDAMFYAVHAQADQLLRDAMDLASATAMRITDVRTVPMPHGDVIHLEASKTGKEADFDVNLSKVLPDLLARRRANKKAEHLMLLAGPFRRPVSYRQLHDRFVAARAAAVTQARAAGDEALAEAVARMVLRDCRKYAADQPATLGEAQELLQHGDAGTTRRHYRTVVAKLRPAR